MTIFIVTTADELQLTPEDVQRELGKEGVEVEQIEVVHDGDSGTQIAGLSYRVVRVA